MGDPVKGLNHAAAPRRDQKEAVGNDDLEPIGQQACFGAEPEEQQVAANHYPFYGLVAGLRPPARVAMPSNPSSRQSAVLVHMLGAARRREGISCHEITSDSRKETLREVSQGP